MSDTIRKCGCPFCRFAEGKITLQEIAWYIKGRIEKEDAFLNLIKNAKSLEELNKEASLQEENLDEDYVMLLELKKNKKFNPDGWWDPALDKPTEMVLEKEIE